MTQNNQPKNAWVVRAGNDNELIGTVESNKAVAIGWSELGDLKPLKTREDFKARYHAAFSDHSDRRVNVNAGQVYRFAREMQPGDYVMTYDKSTRELLIGYITSQLEQNTKVFGTAYPYVRHVKWLKRVSRDLFSSAARDSLGSSLTVFRQNTHLAEIHRLASGMTENAGPPQNGQEGTEEVPFYEEVESRADELIADMLSKLDPYDFQDLVAGVLQAMGFRASSKLPGRDRGVDIIAHPDALGFGKPRIKVQVKHRVGTVGGPEMRNFVATLTQDENGLFVSTGGFASDAKIEADKARVTITLLDRDAFVELMIEHYEKLDPEFQARIPLRKVWVPVLE